MQKIPLKNYTKQEIAQIQLDRAIEALLDKKDLISSITLAGASEEISSKLLEAQGKLGKLTEIAQDFKEIGRLIGKKFNTSDFKREINFFRNELKHHDEGLDTIPIPIEAALEIIDRAVSNILSLTGKKSNQIERFFSSRENSF